MEKIDQLLFAILTIFVGIYANKVYSSLNYNQANNLKMNRLIDSRDPMISEFDKISVSQNSSILKIKVTPHCKLNIKITDQLGLPIYLRQLNINNNRKVEVNTSTWSDGNYDITFTDCCGKSLLIGKFKVG